MTLRGQWECKQMKINTYYDTFDIYKSEAVLNTLVHNDWAVTEPQRSLFGGRMERLSHGGLPRENG